VHPCARARDGVVARDAATRRDAIGRVARASDREKQRRWAHVPARRRANLTWYRE
jgi:Ni,Fe-hydrogenase III large subunit